MGDNIKKLIDTIPTSIGNIFKKSASYAQNLSSSRKKIEQTTSLFETIVKELLAKKGGKHVWLQGIGNMVKSKMNLEIIRKDLVDFKKHLPSGNVLDFGCGSGFNSLLLADEGYEVTAIDLNSYNKYDKSEYNKVMTEDQIDLWEALKQKYNNLNFSHYEDYLSFEDNSFDAVFAYAVLEHVTEELIPTVLAEIKRVLKPNGKLFMSRLPRTLSIAEYAAKKLHLDAHEKLYGDKEAVEVLNKAGFEIKEKSYLEVLPAYPENITNILFPVLSPLDSILIATPLKYFSHHLRIVSEKI